MPFFFTNWTKFEDVEKPGDSGEALHSSISLVAMENNSFKGILKSALSRNLSSWVRKNTKGAGDSSLCCSKQQVILSLVFTQKRHLCGRQQAVLGPCTCQNFPEPSSHAQDLVSHPQSYGLLRAGSLSISIRLHLPNILLLCSHRSWSSQEHGPPFPTAYKQLPLTHLSNLSLSSFKFFLEPLILLELLCSGYLRKEGSSQ